MGRPDRNLGGAVTIPPIETEDQARALVAGIYARAREVNRPGAMADLCQEMLSAALQDAHVTLGAYERHMLIDWYAGTWGPEAVKVVAVVIQRAYEAGLADGMEAWQ